MRRTRRATADMLNVGRVPVRDALRQLVQEGLVTVFPHRGAVVAPISIELVHDVFDIRVRLEGQAARLAATRITRETLANTAAVSCSSTSRPSIATARPASRNRSEADHRRRNGWRRHQIRADAAGRGRTPARGDGCDAQVSRERFTSHGERGQTSLGDFVIKTSDMIQIVIPPPTVIPALLAPVPLVGSGATVLVARQPICLMGDELPPTLRAPLPYIAPPFVTPGMGALSILLTPANMTRLALNGKAILLKGSTFTVQFQVTVPAMQPTPGGPVPDPVLVKTGNAQFVPIAPTVQAA